MNPEIRAGALALAALVAVGSAPAQRLRSLQEAGFGKGDLVAAQKAYLDRTQPKGFDYPVLKTEDAKRAATWDAQAAGAKGLAAAKGEEYVMQLIDSQLLSKVGSPAVKKALGKKMRNYLKKNTAQLGALMNSLRKGDTDGAAHQAIKLAGDAIVRGTANYAGLKKLHGLDAVKRRTVIRGVLHQIVKGVDNVQTLAKVGGDIAGGNYEGAYMAVVEMHPTVKSAKLAIETMRGGYKAAVVDEGIENLYQAWKEKTKGQGLSPKDFLDFSENPRADAGFKGFTKSGHLRALGIELGWPADDEVRAQLLQRAFHRRHMAERKHARKKALTKWLAGAIEKEGLAIFGASKGLWGNGPTLEKGLDDAVALLESILGRLCEQAGKDGCDVEGILAGSSKAKRKLRDRLLVYLKDKLSCTQKIERHGRKSSQYADCMATAASSKKGVLKELGMKFEKPRVSLVGPKVVELGQPLSLTVVVRKGVEPFTIKAAAPGDKKARTLATTWRRKSSYSIPTGSKPGAKKVKVWVIDGNEKTSSKSGKSHHFTVQPGFALRITGPRRLAPGEKGAYKLKFSLAKGKVDFSLRGSALGRSIESSSTGSDYSFQVTAPAQEGDLELEASATDSTGRFATTRRKVEVGKKLGLRLAGLPQVVAAGTPVRVSGTVEVAGTEPPWDLELSGPFVGDPLRQRLTSPTFSVTVQAPDPQAGGASLDQMLGAKRGLGLVATVKKGDEVGRASASIRITPGFSAALASGPRVSPPGKRLHFQVHVSGVKGSAQVRVTGPGFQKDLGTAHEDRMPFRPSFQMEAPASGGTYTLKVVATQADGARAEGTRELRVHQLAPPPPTATQAATKPATKAPTRPAGPDCGTLKRRFLAAEAQAASRDSGGPSGTGGMGMGFDLNEEMNEDLDGETPDERFCRKHPGCCR